MHKSISRVFPDKYTPAQTMDRVTKETMNSPDKDTFIVAYNTGAAITAEGATMIVDELIKTQKEFKNVKYEMKPGTHGTAALLMKITGLEDRYAKKFAMDGMKFLNAEAHKPAPRG